MTKQFIGWDVGGAHLKAVLIDCRGVVLQALQVSCPLWRGLPTLKSAIDTLLPKLPSEHVKHAITMTGELVDAFDSRSDGVLQIARLMQQNLGDNCYYYARELGFIRFDQVPNNTQRIASANWYASADFLAAIVEKGLFIDVGSTTADFVLINEATAQVKGFNDAIRLQTSELVYTGAYRTSIMAVATHVPFDGEWVPVVAEHFATMADVYRITGDCREADEMSDTADGKGKSLSQSIIRLARMIGRDMADAENEAWLGLAFYLKHAQISLLKQAVFRHLSRLSAQEDFCFIAAGAGDFLVKELSQQLGFQYRHVKELIQASDSEARDTAALCFPAFAVATILQKNA